MVRVALDWTNRMPDELPPESLAELLAYAQLEKPPAKL